MSRIRTVKPEFWTSEQVISCSPLSRLLFIGLWNFCDDNGVHPASYVRIKTEVFPADNINIDGIENCISELINYRLIREYMVDDIAYWIVTGWKKHQRIDKPTYRHPLPQSDLKKIQDNSTIIQGELAEQSLLTRHLVDEDSPTEWKGMDRIGMEKEISEVETSPVYVSESNISACTQIFQYWQTVMNHPKAKIDSKRQRRITNALQLGYSVPELKQAIDGCAKTAFNMGDNNNAQRYDDIELILRDTTHIDRFMINAGNCNSENDHKNSDDLMAGVL